MRSCLPYSVRPASSAMHSPEKSVPPSRPARSLLGRILASAVVVGSIAWVVYLLRNDWDSVVVEFGHADTAFLAFGLLLNIAAAYLGFLAFRGLLLDVVAAAMPLGRLGHLYFSAQLMRHLPGRFFGILYQIAATRGQVGGADWITVNALYMIVSAVLALSSAGAVLIGVASPWLAGCWIALFCTAFLLVWSSSWSRRISGFLGALDFPLSKKLAHIVASMSRVSPRTRVMVLAIVLAGWGTYFAAWGFYAVAHPSLGFLDGVMMSALYTVAWLIGYLSFVTPSGLGVREVTFATLAAGFAPSSVAFALIIGRASLLAVDIVLGMVFLRFQDKHA